MPLYLIRQDLTTMDCDAIVNPSNPHLQPGGGLDAAVHKAAGPSLRKACRDVAPCPVGQSRVTPAFRLPCRWVIHTAAPVWRGGLFGEKSCLRRAIKAALRRQRKKTAGRSRCRCSAPDATASRRKRCFRSRLKRWRRAFPTRI